jgi:hypothetical protein
LEQQPQQQQQDQQQQLQPQQSAPRAMRDSWDPDPSGLRFRVPAERKVDWAGPTNYPVMGNVSPNVRGSPREPLFTVTDVDPMPDPGSGLDCGPGLGRIPWASFFGLHHGPLHGCLLMLGATCLAVLLRLNDGSTSRAAQLAECAGVLVVLWLCGALFQRACRPAGASWAPLN